MRYRTGLVAILSSYGWSATRGIHISGRITEGIKGMIDRPIQIKMSSSSVVGLLDLAVRYQRDELIDYLRKFHAPGSVRDKDHNAMMRAIADLIEAAS